MKTRVLFFYQKFKIFNFFWCWPLLILLLFTNFSGTVYAQNKIWDKTYGGTTNDYLKIVLPTRDGGYILGGYSDSGISGDKTQASQDKNNNIQVIGDYWLIKIKADGTKEWDKTFGGNNSDYLTSVQQTRDGGYIVGGWSTSGKSGDKTAANKGKKDEYDLYPADYWIVKLRANGTKEWDKTFGGDNRDELASIQQTPDGGYILGGLSTSGISGDKTSANRGTKDESGEYPSDYWVIKLKANGAKEWDKSFGGTDQDNLTALQQTPDGGYILGGWSNSGKSGDKSELTRDNPQNPYSRGDYWIVKLKNNGSKVWDKTFGGNGQDVLASLQLTNDGGYILGGTSFSLKSGEKSQANKGNSDYWIVKLNANGHKQWDKSVGGTLHNELATVHQTPDGGYILGGSAYARKGGDKTEDPIGHPYKGAKDFWVVKLAPDGTIAWDETIGGDSGNILQSLQLTPDGGYILGGYSYSNDYGDKSQANKGGSDYWVVNLDEKGKKKQVITFDPIPRKTLNNAPFLLSARASSGLPVRYRIVSGPATVKDSTVTLTGTGPVTITARQPGDSTYLPAEVTQTFMVEPASVTKKLWDKTIGGLYEDFLTIAQPTQDGGYILGGYSSSGKSGDNSNSNKGIFDYWVVKLKSDGSKEWDKMFGGDSYQALRTLQQTQDGGYILGGVSSSGKSGDKSEASKGGEDFWIVKLKADGTKEWDKTIGSANHDDLQALQQTQDGGYILGGYSSGISGDKSEVNKSEEPDYWIVKLKANGSKEWDRTIGGNRSDILTSVQQTQDNGYILGGRSNSDKSGDKSEALRKGCDEQGNCRDDYWIVKLSATGHKEWDKTLGGEDNDYLTSLQQTQDGGYILGGYSYSGKSHDKSENNKGNKDIHGNYFLDYWVVKLKTDGTKEWDKTLGGSNDDYLTSLLQTMDGGYLLGGTSKSGWDNDKTQENRGEEDYWVVKLHPNGSKAWDKTFGGIRSDLLSSVRLTPDGSYLVGGTSRSDKSGDKSEEYRDSQYIYYYQRADYWIVKIKEEQPFVAQRNWRYGGSGADNFTSVIKTRDGGYLSGGYTNSGVSGDKSQPSQGKNDYWIVKSDKNGKKLWDKRFGGSDEDYLNRVLQTRDGGYLLAGSSLSGQSGDKSEPSRGSRDYWIVKTDKNGNKQWDKTYGGSGTDELKKVIQLSTGEYVLGGHSNSPVSNDKTQGSWGSSDYWIIKISSTGEKLWDKRYGGNQEEKLGSFTGTRGDGFLLAGSSLSGSSGDKKEASRGSSDFWLLQIDNAGKVLWEKTFGGNGQEEVYTLGLSNGSNLFVAGTSTSGKSGNKSQANRGGIDYWLLKLNATGTKLWDKTFGGSQHDELRFSEYTTAGHYVLAGYSYSGASGDKSQASQGGSDFWVVQVAPNGEKVSDQRWGGSGNEELRTVFQTKEGGLLLGGRSDSGVSGDQTQPSQGGFDYWLLQVAPTTNSLVTARTAPIREEAITSAKFTPLTAFPNPFQDQVTICFTLPQTQQAMVRVLDSQGREVTTLFQGEAQANRTYQLQWQTNDQTTGMYLLRLQTPGKSHTVKLLLTR